MRKKTGVFALACAAILTVSLSVAAEGDAKAEIKEFGTDGSTYISCENATIYAAAYDDGVLKSVSIGDGSITTKLSGESRIFFWDKSMTPLAESMNISTESINIYTVTEYDTDLNTITAGGNTYTLSERFTSVANAVSSEQVSAAEFLDLVANKKQYLGENILLADTDADGKYDIGAYDYYGTAVVDELVFAGEAPSKINFTENTMNIKARLALDMDNTYKFTLDGEEISAADIEPLDVLTIKFNPILSFDGSEYYDITVSRKSVHGYVTKAEDVTPAVYTINGESYAVIDELVGTLTEKAPYDVYLDASGKIAYALLDQYERPIGILTNIYKTQGENVDEILYTAELINRKGETVKYNISEDQADEYLNMLESYAYLNHVYDETTGLAYDTEDPYGTRLYWYPQQVVTYYVDPDTGAFEITSPPSSGKQAFEAEFKASTGRLDGVVMDADADIIDISGVDKGEEIKHLNTTPDLVDGGKYTLFGHLMSHEDYGYGKFTFAVLTDTVYIPETPDTPGGDDEPEALDGYRMAVLQSVENITENGAERTKWTLLCDGEEKYFIVNEDVAKNITVNTGDPLIIDIDKDFEICKAIHVFSNSGILTSFADFRQAVIGSGFAGILSQPSGTYWNNLFPSDGAWTQDMLFGVIVNRSGNSITLCTSLEDGKYINLDRGRELYGVNTSGLCYTCAFTNGRIKMALTTDEAPASTPAFKGAITTRPNGDELLDITNDDVADSLVFAAVRVEDDEIVELYQIYYDYE